jgi:hypothetical protein
MFASPLRDVDYIGNDERPEKSTLDLLVDLEIISYFDNNLEDDEVHQALVDHALSFGM